MSQYTITVENQSESQRTYIVSAEPIPDLEPTASLPVPVILKSSVPADGIVTFSIDVPNPYYAYSISRHDGAIAVKIPVKLGTTDSSGKLVPGTTLRYEKSNGEPQLSTASESTGPNEGFVIKTTKHFTTEDVQNNGWRIGFGSRQTLWTAFAPEPDKSYSLYPTVTLYLNSTNDAWNSYGVPLELDFRLRKAYDVKHTSDGELVIESQD